MLNSTIDALWKADWMCSTHPVHWVPAGFDPDRYRHRIRQGRGDNIHSRSLIALPNLVGDAETSMKADIIFKPRFN